MLLWHKALKKCDLYTYYLLLEHGYTGARQGRDNNLRTNYPKKSWKNIPKIHKVYTYASLILFSFIDVYSLKTFYPDLGSFP